MNLKQLPGRLRKLREAKGWSQMKLALVTGIPNETLCRYESGQRTPKLENLAKLEKALGASLLG